MSVETTQTLVNKTFRRVRMSFAEPVDPRPFGALLGVKDLRADGTSLSFTLHDNLDEVVKLAARHELVNLDYERPSLEEIFLAYYDGEGHRP